jgi:hypothetical protein
MVVMQRCFQRTRFAIALLLISLCPSALLWSDESTVSLTTQLVDTSALVEIESRVLPECLLPGPGSHESLPDYYWAANTDLSAHFLEAQRIYETSASSTSFRSMTLVAGAAGVGKTFIKDRVYKKSYAAGDVCKFDIKELYQQWQANGFTEEKPDLACGDVVLNRLLSVKNSQRNKPYLLDFLKSKSAAFYIVDSLDEIHPDDYQWVLKQIEQFVYQEQRPFVQVVVFGRGLAFRDYWQSRHALQNEEDQPKLFLLQAPKFKTTGDLIVSDWNNDCFRYKLRWSPEGAEVELPLATYQEWAKTGYPTSGTFHSVSFEANASMNSRTRALLHDWSQTQSLVGPMLYNLAGNGILREIVEEHARENRPFDERQVMEAYLVAWMKRECKSDNRPCVSNPEHLALYLHLLQQVAVKSLTENRLDENGYFAVASDDMIAVQWQGASLSFRVSQILDHSGLKVLDPRVAGPPKYRFEPIWAHRLLVEMHNDQISRQVASE